MSQPDDALRMLADSRILRIRDFEAHGIRPVVIRRLHAAGRIRPVLSNNDVNLGYALADDVEAGPTTPDQDCMAEIAVRHPGSVLCLYSGLRYHEMTDEHQGTFQAAVVQGANRRTSLSRAALIEWRNPQQFKVGIIDISFGGVKARITDLERTVVDIFDPERPESSDTRLRALATVANRHGDQGLTQVLAYARALNREKHLGELVGAVREAQRCMIATPTP